MKPANRMLTATLLAMSAAGVCAQAPQTPPAGERPQAEAPVQTPASDTLRLSRQQCVEIALQESPTIQIADLEVKRMDYSKKETLASLFPQIDFSGAYQRSIELQTVSMDMDGNK